MPVPLCTDALVESLGTGGNLRAHGGDGAATGTCDRSKGKRAAHVLRSRAPAGLLAATKGLRGERDAPTDEQGSHTNRAAQLVGRKTYGVCLRDIKRNPPKRLHGVSVEERTGGVSRSSKFRHRLHHARLVVSAHNRNKRAIGTKHILERVTSDHTVPTGLHERHIKTAIAKHARYVQLGVVLDGGENHTRALAIALMGTA
jgi:hypothetical protein